MGAALKKSGGFRVKYDGGIADQHLLSARQFAASIAAFDRITVLFLTAIERREVAQRSPPAESLFLAISPPKRGSVDLTLLPQIAAAVMPFVGEFTEAVRTKLVEHIAGFVLMFWGGRKADADTHMEKILDILDKQRESLDRQHSALVEDRKHERETAAASRQQEREHIERILRFQVEHHKGDAKNAVAPVGSSCRTLQIGSDKSWSTELDEATADAIRTSTEVVVSDVITLDFEVDGIHLSTKTLTVFDPDNPKRRVKAHISDPSFDPLTPGKNPYEEAVQQRRKIRLTGKSTTTSDGTFKAFHAISGKVL